MKAAVLPSRGIGDALLMMIASHQLLLSGYETITCHPSISELGGWFPGQRFAPSLPLESLSSFSLVIFENDNSPLSHELKKLRRDNVLPFLSIFYPSYLPSKHGPLSPLDRVFDEKKPMAENISIAIASLLAKDTASKENGLRPPVPLRHRHFLKRVVIHPTSSTPQKNWALSKYIKLAKTLQQRGYEPVFSLSPKERSELSFLEKKGIQLPRFANLSALATYLYESGYFIGNDSLTGHLASNLQIPTVIVSDNKERMQLWRPGWLPGEVVTAPLWLPKWKIVRQKNWQRFITVNEVFSAFNKNFT